MKKCKNDNEKWLDFLQGAVLFLLGAVFGYFFWIFQLILAMGGF